MGLLKINKMKHIILILIINFIPLLLFGQSSEYKIYPEGVRNGHMTIDNISGMIYDDFKFRPTDYADAIVKGEIIVIQGHLVGQTPNWIGKKHPLLQAVRKDFLEDGILSRKYLDMGFQIWFTDRPFLGKFTPGDAGKHTALRDDNGYILDEDGRRIPKWLFISTRTPLIDVSGVSAELRRQFGDFNKFPWCINNEDSSQRKYFPRRGSVVNDPVKRVINDPVKRVINDPIRKRVDSNTCIYDEVATPIVRDSSENGYFVKYCNIANKSSCPERCSEEIYIRFNDVFCPDEFEEEIICDSTITESYLEFTTDVEDQGECMVRVITGTKYMPYDSIVSNFKSDSLRIPLPNKSDSMWIKRDTTVYHPLTCKKVKYIKQTDSACDTCFQKFKSIGDVWVSYKLKRMFRILPDNTFLDSDGNSIPLEIVEQELESDVGISNIKHVFGISYWGLEIQLWDCFALEFGGDLHAFKSTQWRSKDSENCANCGPIEFARALTVVPSPGVRLSGLQACKYDLYPSVGVKFDVPILLGSKDAFIDPSVEFSPLLFAEVRKVFRPFSFTEILVLLGTEFRGLSSFNTFNPYLQVAFAF